MDKAPEAAAAFRSDRAHRFAAYLVLLDSPHARITGVERLEAEDCIDLEVGVEVPRDPAAPIREVEPVRVAFSVDDRREPSVYALRADFPLDLTHTTLGEAGGPQRLCLWEEPWVELARRLTPEELLARIRLWLSRTASGDLHAAGQPLEPFLPSTLDTLILPAGGLRVGQPHHVVRAGPVGPAYVVELAHAPPPKAENAAFGIVTVTLPDAVHGALRGFPSSLADLAALTETRGFDLLAHLKRELLARYETPAALEQRLLLILLIPKAERPGEAARELEVRGFMTLCPIIEVGERLGVLMRDTVSSPASARMRVGGAVGDLSDLLLGAWRVVQRLTRAQGAALAGGVADDRRVVAVGAGSLGSNLLGVAARAAFGVWTLIDDDIVLPHNTVRQGQGDWAIGFPKADSLRHLVNQTFVEPCVERAILANVLEPGDHTAEVAAALVAADLIVDLSASPAVLGRLSDGPECGRRASLFFNPAGSDLVLLIEDAAREVRLDALEAQYFEAVSQGAALAGHLDAARAGAVRYSNVCRDVSRPLPPWQVSVLSSLGAAQLQAAAGRPEAAISAWRLGDDGGIRPVAVPVGGVRTAQARDWRVTVSEAALAALRAFRADNLPLETGGVLLGVADHARRVLHIVASLPAPPDSRQAPSYFERGVQGLRGAVEQRQLRTAGHVDYVGEWHSHPRGAAARPSREDEGVHAHLTRVLGGPGRPFVMAILGDTSLWVRFACGLDAPAEFEIALD